MTTIAGQTKENLAAWGGEAQQEMRLFDNINVAEIPSASKESEAPKPLGARERRAASWVAARIQSARKKRVSECVTITPEIAAELLSRNGSNRPMRARTVAKYARILQEGRWRLTIEGVAVAKDGTLINGQHRLTAIVESGVSAPMTIWFGCDAEEFAFMDQGTTRSGGDLCHASGLDYWAIRAGVAGHLLRMETRDQTTFDGNRILQKALDTADEFMATACQRTSDVKMVLPQIPATLAYYMISRHTSAPHKLPEFWRLLATGDMLPATSPISRVRDALMLNRDFGRAGRENAFKRAAAVILAWNAWVRGGRRASFTWNKIIELPEVV